MRKVKEWIADHDNQAIPPRVKVRVWFKFNGCCANCSRKLRPKDKPQYDHTIALCNGGQHRETNLRLLCEWCHKGKTTEDVAEKSVTYQKQKKYIGIKPKRQGFRGWRRMNGEIRWAK